MTATPVYDATRRASPATRRLHVERGTVLVDPGPFQASHAGCGAIVPSGDGHPLYCRHIPTWAGLRWYPYPAPGSVWLAFTCDTHVDQVEAARPLLDRDRAELQRRRDHPRQVQPLATGAAGRRLVERAVRYYTPPAAGP